MTVSLSPDSLPEPEGESQEVSLREFHINSRLLTLQHRLFLLGLSRNIDHGGLIAGSQSEQGYKRCKKYGIFHDGSS